jgi:hypothetical protein
MKKWEKLFIKNINIPGGIPRGAIISIGGYLWKVRRRKGKIIYVKEFNPIIITKI